jgi:hypothetical protein
VDCGVGAHHEEFLLPTSMVCYIFLFFPYRLIGCQLSDIAVDNRLLFVVGVGGRVLTVDCRVSLALVVVGS